MWTRRSRHPRCEAVTALPERVTLRYPDRKTVEARVWWDPVDPSRLEEPGRFTVHGVVAASPVRAQAEVTVRPGGGGG